MSQFTGHKGGITTLNWGPYALKHNPEEASPLRFITGGTDGLVKYWAFNEETKKFVEEILTSRPGWIKDVAFAHHNAMGLTLLAGYNGTEEGKDTVAVCGEKTGVSVLRRLEDSWEEYKLPMQKMQAIKVSWNVDSYELVVGFEDGSSAVAEEMEPGRWDFSSEFADNEMPPVEEAKSS